MILENAFRNHLTDFRRLIRRLDTSCRFKFGDISGQFGSVVNCCNTYPSPPGDSSRYQENERKASFRSTSVSLKYFPLDVI